MSKKKKQPWPEWLPPSEEEQIAFARTLLSNVKILCPEIVQCVVANNNKHLQQWRDAFERLNIRPDIYLWENSPVTFPGIRRHSGKQEAQEFGKNTSVSGVNGLVLDDNAYPKEIWSFVLRGCKYDRTNPKGFSLAHIVDHKDYRSKNKSELIGFHTSEEKHLYAGLYTSCANTIWTPNTLLKPTDHEGNLRLLLLQMIHKYYGTCCCLLPHGADFNFGLLEEKWKIENFPQPTTVGDIKMMDLFFDYRNEVLKKLMQY